jgi:epsilon-lactone hydrolase
VTPDPELVARRSQLDQAMSAVAMAAGTEAGEIDAGGVRLLECRADVPGAPALLYFHGGGYRVGSADAWRSYGSHLAAQARVRCLLVDYPLAPEAPFPAAVDAAVRAYQWLLGQVAADRVVVAGDSAGGGLALALLLAAGQRDLPMPAGAALLCPWLDLANDAASFTECADTDTLFSKASADEAARLYLQGADPGNPLASPLLGSLGGLPPLHVEASAAEVLRDDSLRLADRAREAGVAVELRLVEGVPHVWQIRYPVIPESVTSMTAVAAFIAAVTADVGLPGGVPAD